MNGHFGHSEEKDQETTQPEGVISRGRMWWDSSPRPQAAGDNQMYRRCEGTAQKQEGSPVQGPPAVLLPALKTNEAANTDPSLDSGPFVQPPPTTHKLSHTGSYKRLPRKPGCGLLTRAFPC